jgi:hypothetical protein
VIAANGGRAYKAGMEVYAVPSDTSHADKAMEIRP